MKRRRIYLASNYLGPSFSDLPRDIVINILLRLSVKRIFVCKLVCKTWHGLISEPSFAKLHFDQAQAYPMIEISSSYTERSGMVYLVQPEEEDFEHKLDICDHSVHDSKCRCRVKFEIDSKFKLPMVFDDKCHNHNYCVVNSCNGLLCLSNPFNHDPIVVCNPLTGEFLKLPKDKNELYSNILWCGFGFSPSSKKYKVIRTVYSREPRSLKAQIHTLGTKTWKDIKYSCYYYNEIHGLCPTYFNGFLYWPNCHRTSYRLSSFEIENESFSSIVVQPLMGYEGYNGVCIGVLGGELSVSCFLKSGETGVWVMKSVGTRKVWSKVFVVRLDWHQKMRQFGECQPVKYLNDGALLMFNSWRKCFIYKHPRKQRIRYFKLRGAYEVLEVSAHIPSFVSLKDALSGHNVEVLKSRFTELKPEAKDRGNHVKGVYEVKFIELKPEDDDTKASV